MVKWIGKFTLLLKRLRDAWMDMMPMPAMGETRRQNQYLADLNQDNEDRHRRHGDILDTDAVEIRDRWNCHTGEHPRTIVPIQQNFDNIDVRCCK